MSLHVEQSLATAEANPYLEGPYAATHDEVTLHGLEVLAGEIPDDLNGVYVRNGPNPQHHPMGRYHWFDGDGMVHALHFADGTASYRNRWVRTEGFLAERDAGTAIWHGIMEPFGANPADVPEKDTANTDLVFHRDRLLALWYRAGKPYALDPVTLETLGPHDFDGTLRCEVSAHAKVDEDTGELMFFDFGVKQPYMRYGVVGPEGTVRHFVPIDLPGPRLPHDMAITARHSILMDLPLLADPEAARRGRHKLDFQRDLPARFGVIPRYGKADEIRWFEADPCYIYHSVNARDEGDEVVLDVCRVKQPQPLAADARAAGADAHLPAARREPAPLPLRPAHRAHARAGDGRRQQRVPLDEPGTDRAARALHVQHAHLAREDAAVRRDHEIRRRPRHVRDALVRRRLLGQRGAVRAAPRRKRGGRRLARVVRARRARRLLRGACARRARHDRGAGVPAEPAGARAARVPRDVDPGGAPAGRLRLSRLGVSLGLWQDRDPLESLATARVADELGYPELWIGEMATWDAFALAAAIAQETRAIELCVGPLATAVRDPMAMAMGVASVAALARRPVHLAIGSSSQMVVERWHGRTRERTAQHIRETAEALRPLLAGKKERVRRGTGTHGRVQAAAPGAGDLSDRGRVRPRDRKGRGAGGGPDGAQPRDAGARRTNGRPRTPAGGVGAGSD